MKLLIIAPSRTGGRTLNYWLSLELNHLYVHEPFHFHKESFIKTKDELMKTLYNENIVVKVNFGDWRSTFEDKFFFSLFDKIICLTRNNIYDAALSYTKALQTKNFTKGYLLKEEWIENNSEEIKINYEYLKTQMLMTKELQNTLQLTYEGIYETQEELELIKNYLSISNFEHLNLINKNMRYRNQIKLI